MDPGYDVSIEGAAHWFPHRIALLGQGIDSLLLDLEEFPKQPDAPSRPSGKVWLRDERKPYAYRYVRPSPLLSESLGSDPFFGDPHWFLHVIRRDDGDLLIASANLILATKWLAFEPLKEKQG